MLKLWYGLLISSFSSLLCANTIIPVTSLPVSLAFAEQSHQLYVGHACVVSEPGNCGGPVDVIDTLNNQVTTNFDLKTAALTLSQDDKILYGAGENILYATDTAPYHLRWSLDLSQNQTPIPLAIALSPDANILYVLLTEHTNDQPLTRIAIIDAHTGTINSWLPIAGADTLTLSADGQKLYVTTQQYLTTDLVTIDLAHTNQIDRIHLEDGVLFQTITLDKAGKTAYVVGLGMTGGMVYKINFSNQSVQKTILGHWLKDCVLSSDGQTAYITDYIGNAVWRMDLKTHQSRIIANVPMPQNIRLDEQTHLAYVSSLTDNVYVIGLV